MEKVWEVIYRLSGSGLVAALVLFATMPRSIGLNTILGTLSMVCGVVFIISMMLSKRRRGTTDEVDLDKNDHHDGSADDIQ